jgi:glycosyltransferase involved in cell wall biosynthesis
MLHSVAAQSHDNWRVIVVDDMSDRHEIDAESDIILGFWNLLNNCGVHESSKKITFIKNCEGRGKRWEVDNVLHGISMCTDDDIICRIDCDDWLVDNDALTIIDSAYQESGCEALWTSHRWGFSDRSISGDLPHGADPYRFPWKSSHLKTFRKKLINDVKDENFRGPDGNYIKRAGDQAIYLPILHRSKKSVYLPRCVYHYNIDEKGGAVYQTDDAKFQKDEAEFLRRRGFVS